MHRICGLNQRQCLTGVEKLFEAKDKAGCRCLNLCHEVKYKVAGKEYSL